MLLSLVGAFFPHTRIFSPAHDHAPKHCAPGLGRLSATFICFLDRDAADGNDHGGEFTTTGVDRFLGEFVACWGKQRAVRNRLLTLCSVTVIVVTANINYKR